MTRDWGAVAARGLAMWSAGAALLAVAAGASALIGAWSVEPAIAASLVLAGIALGARRAGVSRARRAVGDLAAGLVVLGALLAAARQGPDLEALCLVLIAVGLLTLDREAIFRAGQRLAVAAGFIALVEVVARAYHAPPLAGPAVAPLTLVALAIGVTAARPGQGATGILVQPTAGGMVARRLLPAAILGPFLIGAAAVAGGRGGHYDGDFALALATVADLSLFATLVWLLAVGLHRADARRIAAEVEGRRINAEMEDRVRARTAELAAAMRQYRSLVEDSAEGIIIHRGGVVRFVNAAALQIFGFTSADDVLGTPIMDRISPEHRESAAARVEARLRGEPAPATVEIEALRRDGSRFWLEATGTAVDWEGGPAILVAFIDISERRRREAAEREAASLRSVARLANAAAHEINNPLTVVRGNLQLAAAKIGPRPDVTRHFDQAERGVVRIAEMVEHMTRITRLTALADVNTAGVDTLDLRRSSEPDPAPRQLPDREADPC